MTDRSAERLLERIERTGLLEAWFLATLREQSAASPTPVTARVLAVRLVKSGHLTKLQANKLLADLENDTADDAPGPTPPVAPGRAWRPAAGFTDEELGLAPLDDDESNRNPDSVPGATKAKAGVEEEVILLEDASASAPSRLTPLRSRLDPGLKPLEPLADLAPLDAGPALLPLDALAGLQPLDAADGLGSIASQGLESIAAPSPPGAAAAKQPHAKKNAWDSPLLLLGGGALALMIIATVTLWYALTSGSATELLQSAQVDYQAKSYAQAVAKYEQFAVSFPQDPNISLARVRIGLAHLRQTVEGTNDKRPALKAAGEILPKLEKEPAFEKERAELASILPEIAEGFSKSARLEQNTAQAEKLVDLAKQALLLVDSPKYIPELLRKPVASRIQAIHEDLEQAGRSIQQNKRLAAAIAAIDQAVKDGRTIPAYEVRRQLLAEYPGLDQNPQLVKAVAAITGRERGLVKVLEQPITAATDDRKSAADFRVAFASRRSEGQPGNEQQMVFYLARGAVYGLQASTGQLKWRRSVGSENLAWPQRLTRQPGADVIAADTRYQELLRLKSDNGQIVWRTPIGEGFAEPVIKGSRIFVATQGGRVLDVDAQTGNAARHAAIPLKLQVGPGVSDKGNLYQVAEHSNLYVLDEVTLACKEVYYLGHKPGSIAAPPVMALGHLFLVENGDGGYSDLHVLATDGNGLSLKPALKPIRLEGRVLIPPVLAAARVIVVTDLGAIRVLEVNTDNARNPVADIVEAVVASYKTAVTGYPVFDNGRLWVGDERFTKYDVQTSRNRLVRQWIKDERDVFVAPPQVIGDNVYHLRRRKDSSAYTAAAIQGEDGKVLWEVDLAVPASLLAADMQRKQVHSISAQTELFEVTAEQLQPGQTTVLDRAASSAGGAALSKPFTEIQAMDQGRWVLASPQERGHVVVYDPNAATPSGRLRDVLLKAAGTAQVTATPVFGIGGLILPLDNGQVLLVDPTTGNNKALPFQPTVEAGSKVAWQRAAVVGTEQREFVIADNRRKMFRVGLQDQPEPHLAELAQVQLEVDIVSPLAAVGDTVYGVIRGTNSDTVMSFGATDLAAGKEWPVEGRIVWGPETLNDLVLVATDRQTLLAFEAGQEQRWTSPLSYGSLVGRPLPGAGNLLLASLSGTVWMISSQDGKELTKAEVGEPLGAGPVAFANGSRLLVSAADGTLLVIKSLTAP